jgi:hypothetical protein
VISVAGPPLSTAPYGAHGEVRTKAHERGVKAGQPGGRRTNTSGCWSAWLTRAENEAITSLD